MVWLKSCPKCGGDLYLRQEIEGNEIACFECGQVASRRMTKQLLRAAREELAREAAESRR